MLTPEKLRQMNADYNAKKAVRTRLLREEREWATFTAGMCSVHDMPHTSSSTREATSAPRVPPRNNHAPVYSGRVIAALANAPPGMAEGRGEYIL